MILYAKSIALHQGEDIAVGPRVEQRQIALKL